MASYRLVTGDVLAKLREMPDESVHCVVTSPPYWGLRDYGVAGQIGLEPDVDVWLERLVAVFDEVRRVLRPDGTCWVNLGDAYNAGTSADRSSAGVSAGDVGYWQRAGRLGDKRVRAPGLKVKDLIGQPWAFAFAARAAGWWLRADIIWSKPNPMPESITDRPTKAHEYIFLLSKSARYFYDHEAVREPYKPQSIARRQYRDVNVGERTAKHQPNAARAAAHAPSGLASRRDAHGQFDDHAYVGANPAGRNRRDVWEIAMQPFDGAHFATFPEALVEPCILAGTSEAGCCSECGAPLVRVIERGEPDREHQAACGGDENGEYAGTATKDYEAGRAQNPSEVKARILAGMRERRTTGWERTCEHATAGVVPCTVLDPFSGSATTGAVALRLGRDYIGVELNPKYQEEIARPRLEAIAAQGQLRFHEGT